ncbi:MAG TPA: hypothetical protein VFH85_02125 [Gammaproteobacteria bacterium]|nr:hypothetical protein [Gammaproteobacteria bacterium]
MSEYTDSQCPEFSGYTENERGYLQWVYLHANQKVREALFNEEPRAINAWLNDVDENGHMEIAGQYSYSGNPIVGSFTDLGAEIYGDDESE